jgi:hypothetical protein
MTSFEVTTGDLYAFADELSNLGAMLSSLSGSYGAETDAGSPEVVNALNGFIGHWSSTAKLLGDDLGNLGQKVGLAADAYEQTDAQIIDAAAIG